MLCKMLGVMQSAVYGVFNRLVAHRTFMFLHVGLALEHNQESSVLVVRDDEFRITGVALGILARLG